jgi:serine/threonine protein phosphatase PrpC
VSEEAQTVDLDVLVAGASDIGQIREHNEDHFLVGDLDVQEPIETGYMETRTSGPRGPLLVVCDGMGGVEGGEVASELAAKVMWREMKGTPATKDPEVFARLLRRAARVANHDVHATAKRESGLRGMGTTLSAAGIIADRLVVATVGDPALALLLSEPHTVAESVKLLVAAARAAGGSDNITAIVCEVAGDRFVAPANDDDLPKFREFDPQREGDPALTSTSYVARRLAARIGIPTPSIPPSIPVTGQHPALRSRLDIRLPATALPIADEDLEGPARQRLSQPLRWYWYLVLAVIACGFAWVLGAR